MNKTHQIILGVLMLFLIGGSSYLYYFFWVKNPYYEVDNGTNVSTEVFVQKEAGYTGFRIPAIIKNPQDNSLLAFAEARKDDLSDFGNIDLVMKKSTDGGETWGNLQILWDNGANPIQNPCPVYVSSTNTIYLHLFVNRSDHYVIKSEDGGENWSDPVNLGIAPEGVNDAGPAPGHAIISSEGRIIVPGMHVKYGNCQKGHERTWGSHLIYSDDDGESWCLGKVFEPISNECIVTETFNGSILSILRSNRHEDKKNYNLISYSNDGGISSTNPTYHKDLKTPICQVSVLQFEGEINGISKKLLLHSGPNSSSKREKMTIKLSEDNGRSWGKPKLLFKGRSGYSDLVAIDSDTLGCFFEMGRYHYRESITFVQFDLSWLLS